MGQGVLKFQDISILRKNSFKIVSEIGPNTEMLIDVNRNMLGEIKRILSALKIFQPYVGGL